MTRLTFLGTGSAMPSRSYNACMLVRAPGLNLLVDAGGGNGILTAMGAAGADVAEVEDMFVSHVHTDHLLGAVWIVRMAVYLTKEGRSRGKLRVWGNSDVISAIDQICRLTFLESYYRDIPSAVSYVTVAPGDEREMGGRRVRFFDTGSRNVAQTGFRLWLGDGCGDLTFMGDESLTDANAAEARGSRWLVCGAFCRWADRDVFKPYEKHHHTVADVARMAADCAIDRLVLVHCEDTAPEVRELLYRQEAAPLYGGRLHVPRDLDTIELDCGRP